MCMSREKEREKEKKMGEKQITEENKLFYFFQSFSIYGKNILTSVGSFFSPESANSDWSYPLLFKILKCSYGL